MPKKQKARIGRWSEEKLELLGNYLQAYSKIMNPRLTGNQYKCKEGLRAGWCEGYYYIDAFAGQGWWLAGDEGEERIVKGSPAIALEVDPPFSKYIFIEMNGERVAELELLKKQYPDREHRIEIICRDCNMVLQETIVPLLAKQGGKKSTKRGFVFLDPYTTNIEWDTIKQISLTNTMEIFLNFPIMAANRQALWDRPDKVPTEALERMDRFWGSAAWREYVYSDAEDLFGSTSHKMTKAGEHLAHIFQGRLKEVFHRVTTPLIMRNSKNSALYCLIFAGPNETGNDIAQYEFDRYLKRKTTLPPKPKVRKEALNPYGEQGKMDI